MNTEETIVLAKAAYENAKEAEAAAKANYESLKASQEPVAKAYEEAKRNYDGLKPALNLAKAQVQKASAETTIAFAQYKAVAPKEANAAVTKGVGNAALLEAVTGILKVAPGGMTNGDIFDALQAAGVEMAGEKARANLNSYLSRWGAIGSNGIHQVEKGKWGIGPAPAAPVTPPPFLGNGDVPPPPPPSFIVGVDPGVETPLTEDFPGYAPLTEAGFTTREQLADKTTVEALQEIPGIGAKTAQKILEALAA